MRMIDFFNYNNKIDFIDINYHLFSKISALVFNKRLKYYIKRLKMCDIIHKCFLIILNL